MPPPNAAALVIACAGVGMGMLGCAQAGAPSSADLLQSIRAEIGQAWCEADAQCQVIGVGAKPCGGPEGYLAWSSRVTDRDRLLLLVERHRSARRVENERSGILSDCRIALEPHAACMPLAGDEVASGKRVCQLQALRGSAGAAVGAP